MIMSKERTNNTGNGATLDSADNQTQTLTQRLAEIDQFSVSFVSRDEKGNLVLSASVFAVKVTPPEMFGQNARDFGLDAALELAEDGDEPAEHDFGACFVRPKSLRCEQDGVWRVDLTVDPHNCRYPLVASQEVDDDGNPVLGEDGQPKVQIAPRKEAWITVELTMIEPQADHPLSFRYVQSDRRTTSMLKAADASKKAAEGKSTGSKKGKGKTKRARIDPRAAAAWLADLKG
jgi:hypothetical protein